MIIAARLPLISLLFTIKGMERLDNLALITSQQIEALFQILSVCPLKATRFTKQRPI
jgi:hypothetical protein